ncbi:hypothetical protein [Terrabacter terrigena]|uniref:Uncharacterized protein n=1 Tax=Terrabacter terrigena TaxID=574718 RepID=A0ABW3MYU7_9MICO
MSVATPTRRTWCAAAAAVVTAVLLTACGVDTAPPTEAPIGAQTSAQTSASTTAPPAPAAVASGPTGAADRAQGVPPAARAGADRVEVDKCWTNATATTGGQLLVRARSSDRGARLVAYRADGKLIGEVHNGGGQRYGGTVFPWQATDPVTVTVRSSSGGSVTVPTTPFRPES